MSIYKNHSHEQEPTEAKKIGEFRMDELYGALAIGLDSIDQVPGVEAAIHSTDTTVSAGELQSVPSMDQPAAQHIDAVSHRARLSATPANQVTFPDSHLSDDYRRVA